MTKRDFFILIIKIFGLYHAAFSVFSVLPVNLGMALMNFNAVSIIWLTASTMVVIALYILLIFKSGRIVSLLKLDEGFDNERIEFGGLKPADIIKIGIIIIGGLLIINNVPAFLNHTFFAFKRDLAGWGYNENEKFMWAASLLKLIIGYLLLTNYELIAEKLKMEKKKGE